MLSDGDSKSDGGFEGVIDPPLETSEGAYHNDTSAKAAPDSHGSKLTEHLTCAFASFRHL